MPKRLAGLVVVVSFAFTLIPSSLFAEEINVKRLLAEETGGAGMGFLGGMVTMGIWMAANNRSQGETIQPYLNSYIIGSLLSSALGVYYVGKYGREEGTYLASLLGGFAGTLAGYVFIKDSKFLLYATLLPVLQSAGAVAGFNSPRLVPPLKNAIINIKKKKGKEEKKVSISLPPPSFSLLRETGGVDGLLVGVKVLEAKF